MTAFGWLLVFLGFLGLELLFGSLVSLWFAAGAFGAWIAALGGTAFTGQLWVFLALSFLALFLIRPLSFLAGRGRKKR